MAASINASLQLALSQSDKMSFFSAVGITNSQIHQKPNSKAEFPKAFKDYIDYLEKQLEVPITIISVGPDREATIERNK